MFRSLINLSAAASESIETLLPDASATEAMGDAAETALDTVAQKAMFALENSALGILIVFSVLAVLFIIVKLAANLLNGNKEKADGEKTAAPAATATPAPVATTAPVTTPAPVTDDGEIVAAITAAISLMLESEGKDPHGFRVVSFRRSSTRK